MRRTRRLAIVFSAVLLVGLVALVLRTLDAMGVFTEVAAVACSAPSVIRGVAGAGDMQYDATANALFIAAADVRHWPERPSPNDGIYVYRPGEIAAPFKVKGTSTGFHPIAVSLFRASDGSLTLMAINQRLTGASAVDIFDVSDAATPDIALHERESIAGDLLVSPGGIVAVDKGRFYATNDHTSKTGLGQALEIHLMLPRANVVYFDGADFRVAADGLRLASGIALSPDGQHVYVGEATGRDIRTYERNPFSGDLTFAGATPVDSGLDNIHVAANGNLFVAGQPKLFDIVHFSRNAAKTSLSAAFQIAVDAHGVPRSANTIYAGRDIGGASVGIPIRDRLLIGSGLDPKILSCALPGSLPLKPNLSSSLSRG
jgi:hypothetical protein